LGGGTGLGGIEGPLREILAVLSPCRFTYGDEKQLQAALADVLAASGISARREVRIGPRDRIDLLYEGVGIEVKIASSTPVVMRQVRRYCESPEIQALILVSDRARHLKMPPTVKGKPVRVHSLLMGAF
jgi:hypothetical protein